MSISGPVVTFIAITAYGALHSLLASNPVKQAFQRTLGQTSDRFYRLFFNIAGGLTFLPVLAVTALDPGQTLYHLAWPWVLLTSVGQALAAILLLLGLLQTDSLHFLGLSQLFHPRASEQSELVINGLYCHVRHPLYSAGLLFIWLSPLMTTSVLALNLGLTLYIIIGSIFEERRLVGQFGQAYVEYQRRVPRLIPIPGRCYPPDQVISKTLS
ncbi:MAG: isoprenylcysteine carboxylmethyltransferase family protein [Anaerolineales bacterium]|nr:isoprenylcysteine carboxylmethyltransferase family protein [Anaerolineales bacterium]